MSLPILNNQQTIDPKFSSLQGGLRPWWDIYEKAVINMAFIYLAQGCPDWGETKGKRNSLCTFCSLPYAAADYRDAFFGGTMTADQHLETFRVNLAWLTVQQAHDPMHTLGIFNAGSFLAEVANPPHVQIAIAQEVAAHPMLKRLVIESRAELVTDAAVKRLVDILSPAGKKLTIRIGVETQDDNLRLKVLRKGHSRKQLYAASKIMKSYGVTGGGYVMLGPAPGLDPAWSVDEAKATIDWILGNGPNQLNMDEVYYCSTNVGPGTPLFQAWQAGQFEPPSLWMVWRVLHDMGKVYGSRIHLLPFRDEPEFLAIPSNHNPRGISQDLSGARDCDRAFFEMFDRYRLANDSSILVPPQCTCKPNWI